MMVHIEHCPSFTNIASAFSKRQSHFSFVQCQSKKEKIVLEMDDPPKSLWAATKRTIRNVIHSPSAKGVVVVGGSLLLLMYDRCHGELLLDRRDPDMSVAALQWRWTLKRKNDLLYRVDGDNHIDTLKEVDGIVKVRYWRPLYLAVRYTAPREALFWCSASEMKRGQAARQCSQFSSGRRSPTEWLHNAGPIEPAKRDSGGDSGGTFCDGNKEVVVMLSYLARNDPIKGWRIMAITGKFMKHYGRLHIAKLENAGKRMLSQLVADKDQQSRPVALQNDELERLRTTLQQFMGTEVLIEKIRSVVH